MTSIVNQGRPVNNMKKVTMSAKTVEAAIEKGLEELGITRDEADIEVVEEPSNGLFGLFNKKDAVVNISVKETSSAADEFKNLVNAVKNNEELPDIKDDEEVKVEPAQKKVHEELPFSAKEQEQVAEEARAFLEGIFKGMNLDVQMEKMMNEERILFNLHGDGYRERRKSTLESLAHRLADKAMRTGQKVKLEPMPAGERRIIHLALQGRDDIITDSEGDEPYRAVVIRRK